MNCAATGSAPTDATVAAFSLAAIHATFPPVPPAFTYPIRFKPPFPGRPNTAMFSGSPKTQFQIPVTGKVPNPRIRA
jgi:hypothetical protein